MDTNELKTVCNECFNKVFDSMHDKILQDAKDFFDKYGDDKLSKYATEFYTQIIVTSFKASCDYTDEVLSALLNSLNKVD